MERSISHVRLAHGNKSLLDRRLHRNRDMDLVSCERRYRYSGLCAHGCPVLACDICRPSKKGRTVQRSTIWPASTFAELSHSAPRQAAPVAAPGSSPCATSLACSRSAPILPLMLRERSMADDQKKRGQDKDPISTEVHTFETSGNSAAQKRKDAQEALRRANPAQARAIATVPPIRKWSMPHEPGVRPGWFRKTRRQPRSAKPLCDPGAQFRAP